MARQTKDKIIANLRVINEELHKRIASNERIINGLQNEISDAYSQYRKIERELTATRHAMILMSEQITSMQEPGSFQLTINPRIANIMNAVNKEREVDENE